MIVESQGLLSDSTCVLKAEPGKLDIKRQTPGIIFISCPKVSLFKLAIITSESMCTNYWLTACSSMPRKKCC